MGDRQEPDNMIDSIIDGRIPPWCKRIVKQAGRGVNRFSMIRGGEKILIAVSGGKDSLALSFLLSIRRRWLPVHYDLHAAVINWREYPIPNERLDDMRRFFDNLSISHEIIPAHMFAKSFKGKFDCYLCARNRKRILFERAEVLGIRKIAVGHHLDDIVETTLINLCLRGDFSTMMPVQDFFGGKVQIIRPMCEVREKDVDKLVTRLDLPVYTPPCPYKDSNIRVKMKPIIRELSHIDRQAREHIYAAHFNLRKEYTDFQRIVSERSCEKETLDCYKNLE
jgi:tRNA 2-thiocytidine biosynthesis protein TtcA